MRKKVLSLVAIGVLTAIISGCVTNRVSLVDENMVSVEKQGNETVEILWTDAYQDGEDTVVYGVIRRRSHTSYPIKTHADVAIVSPDGTMLQEARTPDIYVARRVPGKGIDWTRFNIRFPGMLTQGSKVNMVVHSGSHVQSDNKSLSE
jgi:hypothetical protein